MKEQWEDLIKKYSPIFSSVWFYCSLLVVAFFLLFSSFLQDLQKLDDLEMRLMSLEGKAHLSQARVNTYLDQAENAHPRYLEKNLEKLYQQELVFSEEAPSHFDAQEIRTTEKLEETEIKLNKPIEVGKEGLIHILQFIDTANPPLELSLEKPPQIIIQDFHLKRKNHGNEEESYEIDMRLIKREKKKGS